MESPDKGVRRIGGRKVRISATTLESFRLWSDPDQEWMSEESLIDTIKGKFSPTPKMLVGQAFGRALEKPDRWRVDGGYESFVHDGKGWLGYFFSEEMIRPAMEVFDRRGVFEVKQEKQYLGHTVVTKADQILGTRIHENKTTTSSFDFDKYAQSCQWRFMADMFGASAVQYNVFCITESGDTLKSIEQFTLYPYADMESDLFQLVSEFVSFVQGRRLEEFLQPKVYA